MISFLMSDEEWIAIGDMEESEFESFGKERLGMNFRAESEGNPGVAARAVHYLAMRTACRLITDNKKNSLVFGKRSNLLYDFWHLTLATAIAW